MENVRELLVDLRRRDHNDQTPPSNAPIYKNLHLLRSMVWSCFFLSFVHLRYGGLHVLAKDFLFLIL